MKRLLNMADRFQQMEGPGETDFFWLRMVCFTSILDYRSTTDLGGL